MKKPLYETAEEHYGETVPRPFWSWNDKLEKSQLLEQIDAMHRAKIGGFFMHARGGLETEYLSDE